MSSTSANIRWTTAAIVVACAVVVAAFAVQSVEYLTSAFVIDDGLYYLKVPCNVVAGNGVTYDNRTYTNGFHPLWATVCLVLAFLTGGNTGALLRVATLAQGFFVVIGLILLARISRDMKLAPLGVAAAMLAVFFARLDLWLSTMESATLMLALLLLVAVSLNRNLLGSGKVTDNVLLGVILATVFLARLDTIFIVFAFLLLQYIFGIRKARSYGLKAPVMTTGLVFTLLCAPYLVVNQVYFGSIVPVSGIRKMAGSPHLFDNAFALFRNSAGVIANKLHVQPLVFGLAAVVVLAGAGFVFLRPQGRKVIIDAGRSGVLLALVVGVVMRGVYLLTFVDEYTRVPWYWVPEYVLGAIITGILVTMVVRGSRLHAVERPVVFYVVSASLFVAGCAYLFTDAKAHQRTKMIQYETAIWARDNLRENKLFAMYDSGIFSYFSERDVIPLNGLITDRTTMEALRQEGYRRVMDRFGVDYYVRLLNEKTELPKNIIVYQSPTMTSGNLAGMCINILDYNSFPDKTAAFIPAAGRSPDS